MSLIESRAELFTEPSQAELVRRYFQDVEKFEANLTQRSSRAELFTEPSQAELVRRYFQDVEKFEENLTQRSSS